MFEAKMISICNGAPDEVTEMTDSQFVVAGNGGSIQVMRVKADTGIEPVADYAKRKGMSVGDTLVT